MGKKLSYSIGERVETYNRIRGVVQAIVQDELEGEYLVVRLDDLKGEYAYSQQELKKLERFDPSLEGLFSF